jgi:hypothetical protein
VLDTEQVVSAYGGDPQAVRRAVLDAGQRYGADPDLTRKIADQVVALLDA